MADSETNKLVEVEKCRLLALHEYSIKFRRERQHSSDQLKKERDDQKAVSNGSHQRWILNLASDLANQKKDHESITSKLQKKLDRKDLEIENNRQINSDR